MLSRLLPLLSLFSSGPFILLVFILIGQTQALLTNECNYDLVVSHFNEDLKKSLQPVIESNILSGCAVRLYIYSKGVPSTDTTWPYGPTFVSSLPNVGREAHTLTHHFLTHYDDMSDFTIVVQGGFELLHEWLLPAIHFLSSRRSDVRFIGLPLHTILPGTKPLRCACAGCATYTSSWMPVLYQVITNHRCPKADLFWPNFRGQFIVQRNAVRENPPVLYDYLRHLLTYNDSHQVHSPSSYKFDGYPFPGSTASNPHLAHTVERLTTVMFKCYHSSDVQLQGPLFYCTQNRSSDSGSFWHLIK